MNTTLFDCRKFLSVLMMMFIVHITIAQDIQLPAASPRALRKKVRQEKIESYIRQQEEGALVFNKQSVFAFKLNTDGWSFFYEAGKSRTIKSANLFYLELGEKRHPKENKVTNTLVSGNLVSEGNAYVYGKQNHFYECKSGFGRQILIGGKANKNGIGIHWIYSGGLSIGLLRPYYLRILEEVSADQFVEKEVSYNPSNPPQFLNSANILEGTGLRNGWNEMKIVPGIHARNALRFDYGRFNELVSAIETGIYADFYINGIEMMVNNPSQQFFFNAYVAILFGKRK